MSGGRVLHFPIDARRFAVRVTDILEIREVSPPTGVPGSPPVVAGLVEIRGRIVTLVDLARVFGIEARGGQELLAVQFAEPLAHLGLLVAESAHNVESDPAADDGDESEDEAAVHEDAWAQGEGGRPLGREIVLSGARPALLLDPAALAEFCTRRVRERFLVAE